MGQRGRYYAAAGYTMSLLLVLLLINFVKRKYITVSVSADASKYYKTNWLYQRTHKNLLFPRLGTLWMPITFFELPFQINPVYPETAHIKETFSSHY